MTPPPLTLGPDSQGVGLSKEHEQLIAKKAEIFTASSSYAKFVQLRDKRVVGSYAMAQKLLVTCLEAIATVRRARRAESKAQKNTQSVWLSVLRSSSDTHDAQTQSLRHQAMQEIESRCAPLMDGADLNSHGPHADDVSGLEFMSAHDSIFGFTRRIDKSDFGVYVNQGASDYLIERMQSFSGPSVGRHFSENLNKEEQYYLVRFALIANSWVNAGASRDLRALGTCVESGLCDLTFDQVVFGRLAADSPIRKKIPPLALGLRRALLSNDLAVFAALDPS